MPRRLCPARTVEPLRGGGITERRKVHGTVPSHEGNLADGIRLRTLPQVLDYASTVRSVTAAVEASRVFVVPVRGGSPRIRLHDHDIAVKRASAGLCQYDGEDRPSLRRASCDDLMSARRAVDEETSKPGLRFSLDAKVPVPPALMAMAVLLQAYAGASDAEAWN